MKRFIIAALALSLAGYAAWATCGSSPITAPTNFTLPVISGTAQVGQVLSEAPGTWAGNPAPTITHQWFNEGSPIGGATGTSYTLLTTDLPGLITLQETATNSAGTASVLTAVYGPVIGATAFYVDNVGGSDGNAGTSPGAAWATIAHVNAQTNATFVPGTSILFKRGDTWRISDLDDSFLRPANGVAGTAGNPVVFDAYGTGPNPVLQGSHSAATTGAWTNVSGNLWQSVATFPPATANGLPDNNANDIGNIIWNTAGVISTGVEVGGTISGYPCAPSNPGLPICGPPSAPGQWWFVSNTSAGGNPACAVGGALPCWTVQVYSVGNPGNQSTTTMPNLELAQDKVTVDTNGNFETYQNFTFQYGGATTILLNGNNITFRDNVMQWYGGANLGGNFTRYGDAFDIDGLASNLLIERNYIYEIFDTGPSGQPGNTTGAISNVVWRNNVIINTGGSLFYQWEPGTASTFSNFNLYNNTIYSNSSWSIGQHTNGTLQYGMWYNFNSVVNFHVTLSGQVWENNAWTGLNGFALFQQTPFTFFSGLLTSDYNNWSNADGTAPIAATITSVGTETMSAWAAGLTPKQETHGLIQVDPQFTNQSALNLTPAGGSPLRGAGVNLYSAGVVWDFNHQPRPTTGPFTIGAYQ